MTSFDELFFSSNLTIFALSATLKKSHISDELFLLADIKYCETMLTFLNFLYYNPHM